MEKTKNRFSEIIHAAGKQEESLSPRTLFKSVNQNRGLIWRLTAKELSGRYKGSMLGWLWMFLTPLLLIAIYTTVFSFVFKTPMPYAREPGHASFGVYIYSGLLIFTLFSEVAAKAPSIILSNKNYVTRVIFPLELLSLIDLLASLMLLLPGFALLLFGALLFEGSLSISAFLYPIAILIAVPMILGISWSLAAIGVYFRDMSHIISLVLTAMMFLSPIFFPLKALPSLFQSIILLNPLTIPIETARAFLYTSAPHVEPVFLLLYCVASISAFFAGWALFQKTRSGFSDVI